MKIRYEVKFGRRCPCDDRSGTSSTHTKAFLFWKLNVRRASSPADCTYFLGQAVNMPTISNIYLITAISTIGGLLQGFDISSLSVIIGTKAFKKHYGSPDSSTQGGITASISGGSFLGCWASFALIDRLGRVRLLQVGCIIFIIGAILCAASVDIAMLIVGRLLCGFGVG